jgi:hypothetical protein
MASLEQRLERLKESQGAPGSVEAEGIALLRETEPFTPTAARKVRVRAALASRGGATQAWRLRPAIVAAILLFGAAASSASFGRQWVGARYERLLTWMKPAATRVALATAPAVAVAPRADVASAVVEAPPLAPEPSASPPPPAHARPEARAPRHVAIATPAVFRDEPTLVATAMRTLRRDHDAAGAAMLLDEYLRRWPNGALVEEALALAVEAANVRGDGRARELSMRYLERFPDGRFAEAARRTLAKRPSARSTP